MQWREVVEHPSLKDLPFKVETNEWGKIMMTPASDIHGLYQVRIVEWLLRLGGEKGRVSTECPVDTSKGTRVADVAWRSLAFLGKHGIRNISLPESPEVIIEIVSPSNCAEELQGKGLLYFEAGAREFWLCDENGDMRFFNPRGEMKRSELFGDFPEHIDIEI
jgi:Uma2 family endonuclease